MRKIILVSLLGFLFPSNAMDEATLEKSLAITIESDTVANALKEIEKNAGPNKPIELLGAALKRENENDAYVLTQALFEYNSFDQHLISSKLPVIVDKKFNLVLQLFFKKGANPNATHIGKSKCMSTILHTAVLSNWADGVDTILKNGGDPNRADLTGNAPLHIIDSHHPDTPKIIHLFGSYSANPNKPNKDGEKPIELIDLCTSDGLHCNWPPVRAFLCIGASIDNLEKDCPLQQELIASNTVSTLKPLKPRLFKYAMLQWMTRKFLTQMQIDSCHQFLTICKLFEKHPENGIPTLPLDIKKVIVHMAKQYRSKIDAINFVGYMEHKIPFRAAQLNDDLTLKTPFDMDTEIMRKAKDFAERIHSKCDGYDRNLPNTCEFKTLFCPQQENERRKIMLELFQKYSVKP